eukprot:TRINITY_DN8036_c0_g1_i1.p1 TRINITY_DN8036_c0_g1~~TRINITY_DN8036_c0_g1_i1.p1  ORF type:complete len:198 (-),score=27.80 TRINITY_DN8036_c0_g1_i1:132-725(-)
MPVPRVAMVDSDVLHFARALLLTKQLSDIPTSMQGFVTWYPKDKTTFLFTNTVREEVAQFQRALLEHPDARFVFVPSELDAKHAALAIQELPKYIPSLEVVTKHGHVSEWDTERLLDQFRADLQIILEASAAHRRVVEYCIANGIPDVDAPLVTANMKLLRTIVAGRQKLLEEWINESLLCRSVSVLGLLEFMSLRN